MAGDWLVDNLVEGAYLSGMSLASRVIEAHSPSVPAARTVAPGPRGAGLSHEDRFKLGDWPQLDADSEDAQYYWSGQPAASLPRTVPLRPSPADAGDDGASVGLCGRPVSSRAVEDGSANWFTGPGLGLPESRAGSTAPGTAGSARSVGTPGPTIGLPLNLFGTAAAASVAARADAEYTLGLELTSRLLRDTGTLKLPGAGSSRLGHSADESMGEYMRIDSRVCSPLTVGIDPSRSFNPGRVSPWQQEAGGGWAAAGMTAQAVADSDHWWASDSPKARPAGLSRENSVTFKFPEMEPEQPPHGAANFPSSRAQFLSGGGQGPGRKDSAPAPESRPTTRGVLKTPKKDGQGSSFVGRRGTPSVKFAPC